MSDHRQEAFLNHLAEKLGRPRRSGVKPPVWNREPYLHLYKDKSQEELIQQFISNLNQLHTEVNRIHREELGETVERVIGKFSIRSAILWDDPVFKELNLAHCLAEKGIETISWNPQAEEDPLRQTAAAVDLGIARAEMGLAETGTVMLFNGGRRGRLVSLLPPAFLCILRESDIRPRLTQAVQHVHARVSQGLPACINFITGPSRTGDIEMDLAFGVHGPGKVHVILLKE